MMDIQEKVNLVLGHSQPAVMDLNTDALMEKWANAKDKMIRCMNGLVYEYPYPVTFTLDEKARESKLSVFIDWVYHDIGEFLGEFLEANKSGFYDNKVVCEYEVYDHETHCHVTIPIGMKIGKALVRYFTSYYGAAKIDEVRTEMSMVLQEDKVTGILCLSVHPLDYLSSSENNHNWRSCHALDGEYRSGNLSYMCDNCTVIAYLKSNKENVKLPHFPKEVPWNDKKWRCLFHFDFERGVVWGGRQYPFSVEKAYNIVRELLFEPLNYFEVNNSYNKCSPTTQWSQCVFKNEININTNYSMWLKQSHLFYWGHITPMDVFIKEHPNNMAYNDLLNSSYYSPRFLYYKINSQEHFFGSPPMTYGESAPCIKCGAHHVAFSDNMMCRQCILDSDIQMENIIYCDECGSRTFSDYEYMFNGRSFCEECYKKYIKTCAKCNRKYYLRTPPLEETGDWICSRCKNQEEKVDENEEKSDVNSCYNTPWVNSNVEELFRQIGFGF